MSETRCTVCGRGFTRGATNTTRQEYELIFSDTICHLCGFTLAKGFEGIVEMLRQSHGERRERVLDRLSDRLSAQGFDTTAFPFRRR